ncbi:MAG: hypothetical protein Q7T64_01245 [Lacisediminimonas sp.]|nr:hypothetical protein [Lacisediminimonas sp.]
MVMVFFRCLTCWGAADDHSGAPGHVLRFAALARFLQLFAGEISPADCISSFAESPASIEKLTGACSLRYPPA